MTSSRPTRRATGGLDATRRKQTLFSFIPKPGHEWSSNESDDSDYEPGSTSDQYNPVGRRWKSRSPSRGKRQSSGRVRTVSTTSDDLSDATCRSCSRGHELWGQRLPVEIWINIFSMVVREEGALPFLCRASRVCRLWRQAATDSRLWRDVDLTFGWIRQNPRTLRWLVDHRLTHVQLMNLSWWKKIKFEDFRFLFDSCRELRSLNLSHCKLTPNTVKALGALPQLSQLNLTALPDQVMQQNVLCPLFGNLGPRLTELNLSGNNMKGFTQIMNSIVEHCPNLAVLDFSQCQYSSAQTVLNIERLQLGCPRLRVLRLQNTKLSAAPAHKHEVLQSPGFVELEELSIAVTDRRLYLYGIGIASVFTYDDDFLIRTLKNSYNLVSLNVTSCVDISDQSLVFVPACNLRDLRISRCSTGRYYTGLPAIINKWKHSLETIDLSWNRYPPGELDEGVKILGETESPVQSISLEGTSVTTEAVRGLLHGCSNLRVLNLSSCRKLPRGMKRMYDSTETLDWLRDNLGQV